MGSSTNHPLPHPSPTPGSPIFPAANCFASFQRQKPLFVSFFSLCQVFTFSLRNQKTEKGNILLQIQLKFSYVMGVSMWAWQGPMLCVRVLFGRHGFHFKCKQQLESLVFPNGQRLGEQSVWKTKQHFQHFPMLDKQYAQQLWSAPPTPYAQTLKCICCGFHGFMVKCFISIDFSGAVNPSTIPRLSAQITTRLRLQLRFRLQLQLRLRLRLLTLTNEAAIGTTHKFQCPTVDTQSKQSAIKNTRCFQGLLTQKPDNTHKHTHVHTHTRTHK